MFGFSIMGVVGAVFIGVGVGFVYRLYEKYMGGSS